MSESPTIVLMISNAKIENNILILILILILFIYEGQSSNAS